MLWHEVGCVGNDHRNVPIYDDPRPHEVAIHHGARIATSWITTWWAWRVVVRDRRIAATRRESRRVRLIEGPAVARIKVRRWQSLCL
jgi:hypothetical protein